MKILKLSALTAIVLALALASASRSAVESQTIQEAPTTDLNILTDDLFNGLGARGTPIDECVSGPPVANRSFEDNKAIFEDVEGVDDGLGPTYNDTSCTACHQSPETGGISQTNELRAGHLNSSGVFTNPPGGSSLIQLRAIAAPIQERLDNAPLENIRTFRTSLNVIGDGFVEAIANSTLQNIQAAQPAEFRGTIINVPVVEAGGTLRVGRFGWKNQHASLQSFSGDAYLNEMGITNPFDGSDGLVENNSLGASVAAFDTVADPEDDGDDVEAFANFMRATRAPGRGAITTAAQAGQTLFNQVGCNICHTPSIVTAPAGTLINGGAFTVPAVLGDERIRPFSDFLLHNIGTGDGIVQNGGAGTRNMVRTPPLWGVRMRPLLMHDGQSFTFNEAIQRHAGQATTSRNAFNALTADQRAQVIAFLKSL